MATKASDAWGRFRPAVASILERREGTALLALLAIVAVGVYWYRAEFINLNRFNLFLREAARVSVIGYGVALLLITGEFDLSVGAMYGITAAMAVVLIGELGVAPWFAMVVVLGFALVFGISQGVVITKLGLPSFLVTFASLTLLSGAHRILTGGVSADLNDHFFDYFGSEIRVGIEYTIPFIHSEPKTWSTFSAQIIWMLVFLVVFHYLLFHTRFGHHVRAVGDNTTSADTTGIDPDLIKIGCFGIASVMAAFSAMMFLGFALSATPTTGSGLELTVIAVVVLGGTKLTGGEGSMIGVVLGALALSVYEGLFSGPWGETPQYITAMFIIAAIVLGGVRWNPRLARVREWYLAPTAEMARSPSRFFRARATRTGIDGSIGYLGSSVLITGVTILLVDAILNVDAVTSTLGIDTSNLMLFLEGGSLEALVQVYFFVMVLVILAFLDIQMSISALGNPGDYAETLAVVCYGMAPIPLLAVPMFVYGYDLRLLGLGGPLVTALVLLIPILLLIGTLIYAGVRESYEGSSKEALATVGAVFLAWLLAAAVTAIGLTTAG